MPPEFWARVLPRVREAHPDVTVIGEVIHGDYVDLVARSGLDGVTQYELWKATWSSLVDRNLFELAWALDRHTGFVEHFRPMTFVGNHDVTRIASTVGDRGAVLALAVLMTVGGSPSLYYGDEDALRGVKEERIGGDDAVRPELPDPPRSCPRWVRGWSTPPACWWGCAVGTRGWPTPEPRWSRRPTSGWCTAPSGSARTRDGR